VKLTRKQFGISIGVLIYVITLFLILLFNLPLWLIISASIIVSSLIYFMGIFPKMIIIVPENQAWVMANRFKNESSDKTEEFSGYRKIKAQTEFQAGLHWIYPWEEKGEEVNMKRIIPVEGDPEETYTLADRSTVKLKFLVSVVPLPGYIVNFVRHDEEDIIKRVRAKAMAFLQGEIGKMEKASFNKKTMEGIQAKFEDLYGGPKHLEDDEKDLGIWTSTPQIFDISLPKEVEQAINEANIIQQAMDKADEMVRRSNGKMSYGEAMKWASVSQGKAGIGILEMAGLAGNSNKKKSGKKGGN